MNFNHHPPPPSVTDRRRPLSRGQKRKGNSDSNPRRPSVSVAEHMEHLKRHSLAAIGKTKESRKASPSPAARSPNSPVSLGIVIESPPAVFYGNPNQSSGALYAGQVQLRVDEAEVTLSAFSMRFVAVSSTRKPVVRDCPECASSTSVLKAWEFIKKPQHYGPGLHSVPFSYLIPGHLPITSNGDLGRIQYFLDVTAVPLPDPRRHGAAAAAAPPEAALTHRREIHISRAVKPLDEKISLRIFPPTSITARVSYDPVMHPIGDFGIRMLVSGVIEKTQRDTHTRWRLRKMNWRLEETEKIVSPACARHAGKVGGAGRGIAHDDTRNVGREELKSGWKTDLGEGTISMDFSVRPSSSPRPMCDVESPNGTVISHSLVIELIIAEEWAPNRDPERATPTGAARVLRMQFAMMMSERSGMGISWDEEMPPMYEDVPASPPLYPRDVTAEETPEIQRTYSRIMDYVGTPLGPPPPFSDELHGSLGRGDGDDPDDEEFDGLTLGPSRFNRRSPRASSDGRSPGASSDGHHPRPVLQLQTPTAGAVAADGSPSQPQPPSQPQTPTSSRGRHRLDADDLAAGDNERDNT